MGGPRILPPGSLFTLASYHLPGSLLHTGEVESFSSLRNLLFCFSKKEAALLLQRGERQKEMPG